jgi:hypothetical protein
MSLVEHAKRELERGGWFEEAEDGCPTHLIGKDVLALIETLAEQGQSGFSAPVVISLFERLARYEPLGALTGEDDEWRELEPLADDERVKWQNIRCPRVFKDSEGNVYDSRGIIFEEPGGVRYTNHKSRVAVTFPYMPSSAIVKVDDHGNVIN